MMTIVTMIARKKKKVYFAKRGDDDDDDKCDDKCEYPYCEIHNTDCDLLITLCGGVLTDDKHATGEIVANHQFQFDKPHKRMPYIRKDSQSFILKELTIWHLIIKLISGIVKLTIKDYTRFMINLLVNNVLKSSLLY